MKVIKDLTDNRLSYEISFYHMLVPEVNDRQASNLIVPFPGSHVAIFHVQPLASLLLVGDIRV